MAKATFNDPGDPSAQGFSFGNATCASGDTILSGGYTVYPSSSADLVSVTVIGSNPVTDIGPIQGWHVDVHNANSSNVSFVVYALCAH